MDDSEGAARMIRLTAYSILLGVHRSNPASPRLNQIINRGILIMVAFFAGIGALRLINVLLSNEEVLLRQSDGWLMMGLRSVAVIFTLGMILLPEMRQRYLLLLIAVLLLTGAGLLVHLDRLVPSTWQATTGVVCILMSEAALGLVIAGLLQGEDMFDLVTNGWRVSTRAVFQALKLDGEDKHE